MNTNLTTMRALASQAFDMLEPVAELIGKRTVSVAAYSDGKVMARIFFWQEQDIARRIASQIPLAWQRMTSREGFISYVGKNGTLQIELSGVEHLQPPPNEEPLFPDLATEERKELIAEV